MANSPQRTGTTNLPLHADEDLAIGDNVTIGHTATIHCKIIGSYVMIGNNATLLDGAEIGDYCIIAAGSIVTPNTIIPNRSVVMGIPGRRKREISSEQLALLKHAVAVYVKLTQKYKEQGF